MRQKHYATIIEHPQNAMIALQHRSLVLRIFVLVRSHEVYDQHDQHRWYILFAPRKTDVSCCRQNNNKELVMRPNREQRQGLSMRGF